jgi:hypothetical protein
MGSGGGPKRTEMKTCANDAAERESIRTAKINQRIARFVFIKFLFRGADSIIVNTGGAQVLRRRMKVLANVRDGASDEEREPWRTILAFKGTVSAPH